MIEKIKQDPISKSKWTKFYDMSSGGERKLQWDEIIINLPEKEAVAYFEEKFGRDPNNVTCSCCGKDYLIMEFDSLQKATEYDCKWKKTTLEEYVKREDVLVLEL